MAKHRLTLDQRQGRNDLRSGKEVWSVPCPQCPAKEGQPCFLDKPKLGRGWGGYERYINHRSRSMSYHGHM